MGALNSVLATYETKPSGTAQRVTWLVFQMKPASAEVDIVICVQVQAEEGGCEPRLVYSDVS